MIEQQKYAGPETNIILQWFLDIYGPGATITPYVYEGLIAGNPIGTWDIHAMYFAFEMQFNNAAGGTSAIAGLVTLYDHANVASQYYQNSGMAFNAGYQYVNNTIFARNDYFSRVSAAGYNHIHFVGLVAAI